MKTFIGNFILGFFVLAVLVTLVFYMQMYRGSRPEILHLMEPESRASFLLVAGGVCAAGAFIWAWGRSGSRPRK